MKIDLHMHTKKASQGDPISREINDGNKFRKIMMEADIQIGAITNHNIFDKKQYNDLKSNDDSFILLPGIEYDVNVANEGNNSIKRRQINIIFDPSMIDEFDLLVINNKSNPENPIHINKIIEIFDSKNTIFYFDFKKGKTSWLQSEINKHFFNKENSIQGIPIFDTQKVITHFILQANNFKSLIGSDLKDWDNYIVNDSQDLIDSKMRFMSYEVFINVLKCEKNLKIVQELRREEKININDKKNQILLNNVPISNGVNIIFGAKSTGKTKLLEELHKNYNGSSKLLYKSEDYLKTYNKILAREEDRKGKKHIEALNEEIIKISNHSEEQFNKFTHFYESFKNPPKFKIQATIFQNELKKDEKFIVNMTLEYRENVKKITNFLKNKNVSLSRQHLTLFDKTIVEFKKLYLEEIKNYFSFNIKEQIKSKISEIIIKNKNQVTKPDTLGLFKLFDSRKNLWNNIENIKQMKTKYTFEYQTFNIPEGNSWTHIQELSLFDFSNKKYIDGINFKQKDWKEKKDYFGKLVELFNIKKYSDPREYIPKIKWLVESNTPLYNIKNLLAKKVGENTGTSNSEPSNGEKAFISLFSELESQSNIIFLDEPETYLGNKMISNTLIDKLKNLSMENKKIIITTHVSSLGINTLPSNYIYRDLEVYGDQTYKTYVGNFDRKNELKCLRTDDTINMIEHFVQYFEGDKEQFNFRKDIYENDKF